MSDSGRTVDVNVLRVRVESAKAVPLPARVEKRESLDERDTWSFRDLFLLWLR